MRRLVMVVCLLAVVACCALGGVTAAGDGAALAARLRDLPPAQRAVAVSFLRAVAGDHRNGSSGVGEVASGAVVCGTHRVAGGRDAEAAALVETSAMDRGRRGETDAKRGGDRQAVLAPGGGLACRCDEFTCECDRACGCAMLGDGGRRLMEDGTVVAGSVASPGKPHAPGYTFRCDCRFGVDRSSREFDSMACSCGSGGGSGGAAPCRCQRRCVCDEK